MSKLDLYPNKKSPPSDAHVATGTEFAVDKVALDVNVLNIIGAIIGGSVSVAGLKTAQKIQTGQVTDVASKIPSTPLTDRNFISIQNMSETEILYIGNSDVEANRTVGGKGGWEVGPGETLNENVQDDVEYYGIAETGKTVLYKVRELA